MNIKEIVGNLIERSIENQKPGVYNFFSRSAVDLLLPQESKNDEEYETLTGELENKYIYSTRQTIDQVHNLKTLKSYYDRLANGYKAVAKGCNEAGFREAKRLYKQEEELYRNIAKSLGFLGDGKFAYEQFLILRDSHNTFVNTRTNVLANTDEGTFRELLNANFGTKYTEERKKQVGRYDKFVRIVSEAKKIPYQPILHS